MIGNVAASFIIAFGGSLVGDYVRRVGKYKLDSRLRIVAAVTMFGVWIVGFTVASMLGVWNGVFMNIVAYIGLDRNERPIRPGFAGGTLDVRANQSVVLSDFACWIVRQSTVRTRCGRDLISEISPLREHSGRDEGWCAYPQTFVGIIPPPPSVM
jgi:hypothetical protein